MNQSRTQSLIETLTSTVVGFVMSLTLSAVIFPLFGHAFTPMQNIWIVLSFTVLSVIRGYVVRRLFVILAMY